MTTPALLQSPLLARRKKPSRKIPDHLVRESFGGARFFYPGYADVLQKTKTIEDAMADSTLQWTLKEQIGDHLKSSLDKKRFRVGRGEVGVHLGPTENMGLDIAFFDQEELSSDKIGNRYAPIAPLLAIEIDINVEPEDKSGNLFEDYCLAKIERLIQFGTRRFLWIFSKSQKVFIAEPGTNWHFVSWGNDIELMAGISFNVAQALREEGIV